MLKIYSWLTGHLLSAEISVEKRIKSHLDGRKSSFFFAIMLFLGAELFLLGFLLNLARFFIVIFLDSGKGFNAVFRQQELHRCKHSYSTYKDRQKKLRTFSFATLATIVIAVGIVSLVMNLLFSDKLTGWAQTFSWQQTSWTSGASSTAIATHSSNQTGWARFSSSTANIATTTGGAVTLTASSVVATLHTSDADFNSGTLSSQAYVAGGAVKLTKPVGATCTTHGECLGGLTGTCYQGVCQPTWQTVKPVSAAGISTTYWVNYSAGMGGNGGVQVTGANCQTVLNAISVMARDLVSTTTTLWSSTPAKTDFTFASASAACASTGGRLPTGKEWLCIVANYTTYLGNFSVNSSYLTSSPYGSGSYWYGWADLTYGACGSGSTCSNTYVRCVK